MNVTGKTYTPSVRLSASTNSISRRDTPLRLLLADRSATAAGSLIRRNQNGDQSHELHQSRSGKLATHRDLLRRPRLRIASRAHPWLAVERRRVGEADRRAARGRPSRHYV